MPRALARRVLNLHRPERRSNRDRTRVHRSIPSSRSNRHPKDMVIPTGTRTRFRTGPLISACRLVLETRRINSNSSNRAGSMTTKTAVVITARHSRRICGNIRLGRALFYLFPSVSASSVTWSGVSSVFLGRAAPYDHARCIATVSILSFASPDVDSQANRGSGSF